jgi:hydrogenase nickel incorporation protein HypA/HybF
MHELSVSAAVVDTAVKHAAGRPVLLVSVRLGHLRQVIPDSLAFYFDLCARGTVCEGAKLEWEVVPAVLRCAPCAHEWPVTEPAFRCPRCDGAQVTAVSGEELEVASIEVEEEPACTV